MHIFGRFEFTFFQTILVVPKKFLFYHLTIDLFRNGICFGVFFFEFIHTLLKRVNNGKVACFCDVAADERNFWNVFLHERKKEVNFHRSVVYI